MKKKNCKKVTSYNCGNSCINERYVCRKVGLAGQSVDIANRLSAAIDKLQTSTAAAPEPEIKAATKAAKVTKTKTTKKLKDKTKKAAAKPAAKPKKLKPLPTLEEAEEKIIMLTDLDSFDDDDDEDEVISKEHFKVFSRGDTSEQIEAKLADYGVSDPKGALKAIRLYGGVESSKIKKDEANGVPNKNADLLNEVSQKLPAFEGPIYSGFQKDMVDVYGLNKLKPGDKFQLPSISSFSSDRYTASMFAQEGGMIQVNNNKSASSIALLTGQEYEEEVLANKNAKYELVEISEYDSQDGSGKPPVPLYILNEI